MHDDDQEHSHGAHDDPGDEAAVDWDPDGLELTSVGIDIGSSTSHLIFSRLSLKRRGLSFSSRFEVVEREVLHRSPVLLTPYSTPETIDTEALARFVARSYEEAGLTPAQIDTGAVICTGEAVKKHNSEAITRLFSSGGGKFVCATAGPNLEAALAAHGSGAVARSRDKTVVNVDVGGGTTKLTVVEAGAIVETAAINVGARLVAWDSDGKVNRSEAAGARIAASAGVSVQIGRVLRPEDKLALAQASAELLFQFVEGGNISALATELLVTPSPTYCWTASDLVFSGGVSEYIYERDSRDYGDLGPLLGAAIRDRFADLNLSIIEPDEGLRATVIGASQYSIKMSSSTIYLSRRDLLPCRDLLVIAPRWRVEDFTAEGIAGSIEKALQRFDLIEHQRPVALSLSAPAELSYDSLRTLAQGIHQAIAPRAGLNPVVLVFDADVGKLVGAMLKEEQRLSQDVIAVDEIEVGDFDFIDIGEPLARSWAVPVVVKSLVFR